MFYHGNALTTSNMEKAAKRENSLEGNTQESCLHKVSLGTGLTGDFVPATSSIEVGTQGLTQEASTVILRKVIKSLRSHR